MSLSEIWGPENPMVMNKKRFPLWNITKYNHVRRIYRYTPWQTHSRIICKNAGRTSIKPPSSGCWTPTVRKGKNFGQNLGKSKLKLSLWLAIYLCGYGVQTGVTNRWPWRFCQAMGLEKAGWSTISLTEYDNVWPNLFSVAFTYGSLDIPREKVQYLVENTGAQMLPNIE